MERILIVRLGSLGDIVHAIPAAAALRDAFPAVRLDWLVDERHREILDLVPIVDRWILFHAISRPSWREVPRVIAELRRASYDAAVDLQGLLKSAVLARASGAPRVLGFAAGHLRERTARPFYTEVCDPAGAAHVIDKNLALARCLGAVRPGVRFPLNVPDSPAPAEIRKRVAAAAGRTGRFAIINPSAAWPNKRWPTERFGGLARHLLDRHGVGVAVTWGPGEESLAREVASASSGSAIVAPPTSIGDLVAVVRAAEIIISGDTGPLHIAAAVGTPIVGIYGPTDPRRNGPWAASDVTVSRFATCECHHRRRCRAASWCLNDIAVREVMAAVDLRMAQIGAGRTA